MLLATASLSLPGLSPKPEPVIGPRSPNPDQELLKRREKKQDQLTWKANQNGFLQVVHHGKVDVSHVQAKFHSAMAVIAERTEVLSFELKAKKRTQNRNT